MKQREEIKKKKKKEERDENSTLSVRKTRFFSSLFFLEKNILNVFCSNCYAEK